MSFLYRFIKQTLFLSMAPTHNLWYMVKGPSDSVLLVPTASAHPPLPERVGMLNFRSCNGNYFTWHTPVSWTLETLETTNYRRPQSSWQCSLKAYIFLWGPTFFWASSCSLLEICSLLTSIKDLAPAAKELQLHCLDWIGGIGGQENVEHTAPNHAHTETKRSPLEPWTHNQPFVQGWIAQFKHPHTTTGL